MPQSRKRPGHHEYRKPADIPASQRTKGRITMAVLFGVFGLLTAIFASGGDTIIIAAVTVLAAVIGFVVGKMMEKDATHKER